MTGDFNDDGVIDGSRDDDEYDDGDDDDDDDDYDFSDDNDDDDGMEVMMIKRTITTTMRVCSFIHESYNTLALNIQIASVVIIKAMMSFSHFRQNSRTHFSPAIVNGKERYN